IVPVAVGTHSKLPRQRGRIDVLQINSIGFNWILAAAAVLHERQCMVAADQRSKKRRYSGSKSKKKTGSDRSRFSVKMLLFCEELAVCYAFFDCKRRRATRPSSRKAPIAP